MGIEQLIAKAAAVDNRGELTRRPIDGLRFCPIRAVPHEDPDALDLPYDHPGPAEMVPFR